MLRRAVCSLAEVIGDATAATPEWILIRELLDGRSDADLQRARAAISDALKTNGNVRRAGQRIAGYVGVQTDTGHSGGSGAFGMLTAVPNGAPNTQLQIDFAYRSEHLMAVLAKQLIQAFYGQPQTYSYWNGCFTGGRQGLRMAQDFPNDYDGYVIAAPAIHWDRFIAAELWPQVVMQNELGRTISSAKLTLATNAAIAQCDALDGVTDGLLNDPRQCTYNPVNDAAITTDSCTATNNACLMPAEATAIQKIWTGPTNAKGKSLWYGLERGAARR